MKKKRILIGMLLLILFVSTMSFVSAADGSYNDNISDVDNNENIIQTSIKQDETLKDASGTFAQLDSQIQNAGVGSTLILDKNYTYSTSDTNPNGIIINKNLTIDGKGHTLDGSGVSSIFIITGQSHVTLKNITFANAYGSNGAALSWTSSSNVNVKYSTFRDNYVSGNGGAIYVEGNGDISLNSNISYSTFTNNHAVNGGAIYAGGILVSIISSNFNHNNVTNNGGSLFLNVGAYVSNCVFDSEHADNDGGAIYLNSIITDTSSIPQSILDYLGVFNSNMTHCSAGHDGGAGYINASHGTVRGVLFAYCSAGHNAGAGYVNGNYGKLLSTTFINNTASNDGGAVVWVGVNGTIYGIKVINNTAINGDGGGIYLSPTAGASIFSGRTLINSSYFSSNKAARNGGGLYCSGLFTIIVESNFTHDSAYDGAGIYLDVGAAINKCYFYNENAIHDGGGIYLYASNVEVSSIPPAMLILLKDVGVKNTNIINCSAGHDGGAGYVHGDHGVVDNTTMVNCTAGNDGGAGYVSGRFGKLSNSQFINNVAYHDGGALLWLGVNGTIDNISVIDNKASFGNGGGICLDASKDFGLINVINSTFSRNTGRNGGALYCAGMFSNIINCQFTFDSAYCGAGIYLDYGAFINQCYLFKEVASYDGGGIYLNSSNTDLDPVILKRLMEENKVGVINSRIINCSAGHDGGAGYVYGSYGIVNNVTMINNYAGRDGGAGYVSGNYGRLYNSSFINNHAGDDGGALMWTGNGGIVSNLYCNANTCQDKGGTLHIVGSNLNLSGIECYASVAITYGGAVYISGNDVDLKNSKFERCTAITDHGGAIYISGLRVDIIGCNFSMNRVNNMTGRGGSIDVQGNKTTIANCTFDRNIAYEGGALYINGSNVVIDGYSSNRTTADIGAAIYVMGDYALIRNFDISHANATIRGGGIYISGDFANITNANFTRCMAFTRGGGAVYVAGLHVTISDSNFFQNRVNPISGRGGCMNIQGNFTHIYNCTFDMCTACDGGVIYVNGSYAVIDGYSCNRSLASNNGGALYILGDYALVCNFNISNTNSTNYGGAIYIAGNNTNITNSNFTRCTAYIHDGGALYVLGVNTTIAYSNFEMNKVNISSQGRGGSIDIQGDYTRILKCKFDRCTAYEGGVIYVKGNHVEIDGYSCNRSFATNGGAIYVMGDYVDICNFDISHTNATSYGGALYVAGDFVNVVNSSLTRCIAYTGHGGAAYISGLNVTILNSTFVQNRVVGVNARGGSIDVQGNFTRILDCLFDMCSAYEGGVIYVNGTGIFVNNTISNRSSATVGGAIYVRGDNATISGFNSSYSNATRYGGAVYVSGHNTNIVKSIFQYTISTGTGINGGGGAIYIAGENALINLSSFKYDRSVGYGGSICVVGNNASILDSNFSISTSSNNGGAIYIGGFNNTYISGSSFFICNAVGGSSKGGAIYIEGPNTYVVNSSFTSSHANTAAGGIYIKGVGTNILNCVLNRCSAATAGAIYVEGNNATISKSKINHNNATTEAGAMYVSGAYLHLNESSFDGNIALAGNGGAIVWNGGHEGDEIIACNFTNNEARGNSRLGGAIYWDAGEIVTPGGLIKYCNFISNRCNKHGGAIDWYRCEDGLIDGCTFINNVAQTGDGGAIYCGATGSDSKNLTISNTIFTNNTSPVNSGGAISNQISYSTIVNCTFNEGYAKRGGFIVIKDGSSGINTTITNCTFINAHSVTAGNDWGGGACYINVANVKFHNSVFINTYTLNNNSHGGAIAFQANANKGQVINCTFINASANDGGAIAWTGNNGLLFNSTFINNRAAQNGGAVYWSGTGGSAGNCTFISNYALSNGGAIYWTGGSGRLYNSSFILNGLLSTSSNGGAVYWSSNAGTIANSIFKNNTANNGGAIYWVSGSSISNSIFNFNKAATGSAFYISSGSNVEIINTELLNNRANYKELTITEINKYDNGVIVKAHFKGYDNILNAIYTTANNVYFTNVTYLGVNGSRSNTGRSRILPTQTTTYPTDSNAIYLTDYETNQTVTIEVYDDYNNLLYQSSAQTNISGEVKFSFFTSTTGGSFNVKLEHPEDDYYTYVGITDGGKQIVDVNVSTSDINYLENEIINITVYALQPGQIPTGNVSIYINNVLFNNTDYILDSNGKVSLNISGLNGGIYHVAVVYNGDVNYFPDNGTSTFNVWKLPSFITVEVHDFTWGQSGNITIHVPQNENNTIILEIDDANYTVSINESGYAVFTIPKLNVGTHTVVAFYPESTNYLASQNHTYFLINKIDPSIRVDAGDIDVGEIAVINITVNPSGDVTGNVTIYIDGINKGSFALNNQSFLQYNVSGLSKGVHGVVVIYQGDINFNYKDNATTFNVDSKNPKINITTQNITVGQTENIIIKISDNATGIVLISVNGKGYYGEIEAGEVKLSLDNLENGTYVVYAKYIGNENYTSAETSANFTVSKLNSTIMVNVDNITVGNKAIVNLTLPVNATGIVTVKIANKTYNVTVAGGNALLIISDLGVGKYTVNATYLGDLRYLTSNNSTEFSVFKVDVSDGVKVIDQANGTVIVIVPGNATGNVTIKINNTEINATVINGTAIVNIGNITPGTHNITVIYSGDENHTNATINTTVNVLKLKTPIQIHVTNIYVGDILKITANLPVNATGDVEINIDGKIYTNQTKNGNVTFYIPNLTYGNKTASLTYAGDAIYLANYSLANFTVFKRNSTIIVKVENIKVDENATVNVTVSDNATGGVYVTLGELGYYINVVNGTGFIEIPYLRQGNYNLTATYAGDEQFLSSTNLTKFNVTKWDSFVNVSAQNIAVGDVEEIIFTVPGDATGNITVIINDKTYNVAVSGGIGRISIFKLHMGNYRINATYNGNYKYLTSTNNTITFKVAKHSTEMEVIDEGNKTIMVVLHENATGNVTVVVNNQTYFANLTNGSAMIYLENLTPGRYDAVVYYSGDVDYANQTVNATVRVKQFDCPINITVDGIYVGETAIVNVTIDKNAKGIIVVEIDGKMYNTTNITQGNAIIKITNLTAGAKSVSVRYLGDENYNSNFTTAVFNVFKHNSAVKINVTNIIVGDEAKIIVNVSENATGYVIIKIHNQTSVVELNNALGIAIVKDLTWGNYTVYASYIGDDYYLPSNTTGNITVSKVNSTISVKVDNIAVGSKAIVNITVPEDATGIVNVVLNGKNYNVTVSAGIGILVVSDLNVGNYTIEVSYLGDKKYFSNTNSTTFSVTGDLIPDIEVTPTVINEGEYANITVKLPQNATGNVTIKINGTVQTKELVNGSATFEIGNLTSGVYDMDIKYSGDANYSHCDVTKVINVAKPFSPEIFLITENSTDYYNHTRFNARLLDFNKSPIQGETIKFIVNGKTYTALTDEFGYASIDLYLPLGNYLIESIYESTGKYNSASVNNTIVMRSSIISSDIKRGWNSPYDYEAEFLDGSGHVLANADVKFIIGGHAYIVKTDKEGIARLTTSKLAIGKYDVTIVNMVTGEMASRTTTIVKRIIGNKDITMDFADGTYYAVRVIGDDGNPVGAGEFVSIYANTVYYPCKTDKNGYAKLKINLNPNKFKLTAEYKNYKVSNKLVVKQTLKLVKSTIVVKKSAKSFVIKTQLKWSNGKPIKGKKLVVTFKGKHYKVKTNSKGIASLKINEKIIKKLAVGKKHHFAVKYITDIVKGVVKVKK